MYVTTNVCVSGMECVCACPDGVRMCIWDAVCAHLRVRVTGHKPVCLCVSLGVSQRGSGCRDGVLEGVCFGWGDRESLSPGAPDRAGVSACGAVGSRLASPPPPNHQGWARGARTRWLLLPLPLTHSLTKVSVAGGSQPLQPGQEWFRARQWLGLRGPPRSWSRQGRAAAPARGEARPRGPRAARQAARAAPLPAPRLRRGAHPSTGGGAAQDQHPTRLPRAPLPGSGAPRSLWLRVRGRCCVHPPRPGVQRVPGRRPLDPRGRAGCPRPAGPGKKA